MKLIPQFRLCSACARTSALLVLPALSVFTTAQTTQPQAPVPAASAPSVQPKEPGKRQRDAAEDAYLAGARLLDRNDPAAAETQFAKAVRLNPANHEYAQAFALAREHHVTELVQQAGKARLLGRQDKAESYLAEARQLDPQNPMVLEHALPAAGPASFSPRLSPEAEDTARIAGPIVLQPSPGKQSFHLHSDIQDVLRRVASSYGLRATFDSSVTGVRVRFDLDDTTYEQAMPIALQMNHLFAVPLDAKSILIAKDSPENRQRLERLTEETIYVPGMTNEQMTELGNIVKNIFDLKQVTTQNSAGTVIVRAPDSLMNAINLTLADLVDGGSQIMIELRLYSVDKTVTRNTGTQPPQQIGVYNVETAANNLVSANQTLVNQAIAEGLVPAGSSNITIALALIASGLVQSTLLSNTVGFFGGGTTASGVTVSSVPSFTLALNSSDTRAIDDLQIRIGDRQTGTFRVGSRYPITTATYTSTASSLNSSALAGATINGVSAASLLNSITSSTVPQIQYEDLGFTLKATPTVQKSGDITMHLELKIESLTGSSINNIPVLNNQQFDSWVTIADGATALMASSVTKSEAGAISGLSGLGELPGFQSALADNSVENDSSELVLLVTPHLVRRRSNVFAGPRIALSLPQTSE